MVRKVGGKEDGTTCESDSPEQQSIQKKTY